MLKRSRRARRSEGGRDRVTLLIAAGAVCVLLVAPVAFAGAGSGSSGPEARAAGVKQKVKKLKKTVKELEQQVAEIELQPGPQGPAGPSTGVAGGDLTGSYPNPAIATNAVTSSKLWLLLARTWPC